MSLMGWLFRRSRLLPGLARYVRHYENLRANHDRQAARLARYERGPFLPGHYHSPLPDFTQIEREAEQVLSDAPCTLKDIALNTDGQLALLRDFAGLTDRYAPPDERDPSYRFWYRNDFFSYLDASVLAAMLLYFKPRQVFEVGSGYSSAVILDVNERYLSWSVRLTMIEPYPDRLHALLRPEDLGRTKLIQQPVEVVDPLIWSELSEDDVLFIDSSHVSKIGSDVNYIFFGILPQLRPGVIVHFHDVFYPFDYPREWVLGGVAWNEAYLLRAFLQNNEHYQILLFNDYLKRCHREILHASLPASMRDPEPDRALVNAPGASIWLRKVR